VLCTKCKFGELSRTKRVGLMEELIYPHLGYFPWICSECKERVIVKHRGERSVSLPHAEEFPAPRPSERNS
jgi:hypothetical protein